MGQVADCLKLQPGSVLGPSLALSPTQSWQLFVSRSTCVTKHNKLLFQQVWNVLLPEPDEAYHTLEYNLCREGEKCNNLSFTLEGISWHAPNHSTHKNYTSCSQPLDLCRVYLPSSGVRVSYQGLQSASHFLLLLVQLARCHQHGELVLYSDGPDLFRLYYDRGQES